MKALAKVLSCVLLHVFLADTGFCEDLDEFIEDGLAQGLKTIVVPEGEYSAEGTISIGPEYRGTKVIAENDNVRIVSSQKEPVFSLRNASDFELSGFTFRSILPENPESPVAFYYEGGGQDWTTGAAAILVEDSSRVKLTKNHIRGYWMGIYITSIETPTTHIDVANNTVEDCGYWSIAARVDVQPDHLLEKPIQHISFVGNKMTRCEQGPVFKSVSAGVMKDNEVFGNIIGIRIEKSQFCIIRDNRISKNLQSGIWIYNRSYYNHIFNNTISDNNLQAERIIQIARERKQDQTFLPGDIERYESHPVPIFAAYNKLVGDLRAVLAYEPHYWPNLTAYEYITPSNRVKNHLDPALNEKFWGMYFSQWGAFGIEIRSDASYNLIEHNTIFNSRPLDMHKGYMVYGIKIHHLANYHNDSLICRSNLIRDNDIQGMVDGEILNVNETHGIDAGNIVESN